MAFTVIGRKLAHYHILEKIGSGGMGDVYLAEDQKLDRKVALKVLPPALADNEERRARFQREAKAIAALDHPNIVQVFSVEQEDDLHFIVMELVRGKTLRDRLREGGSSVKRFLDVAIPLVDAVAAAHSHNITHRDLKPDNVMVSDEGRVKVLDFGLAKPAPLAAGQDSSDVPTAGMTREGLLLGTLHYMSPEQAEGKSVDARSDIFSLGVIFYEMLSGARPFEGETPASTLSSILKDTPEPLSTAGAAIPHDLVRIVRRCLVKDPERRFQCSQDLRNELEELAEELPALDLAAENVAASGSRASGGRRAVVAAASLAAALTAALAFLGYALLSPRDSVPRFTNPLQLTSDLGVESYPTWSPEGSRIAYMSNRAGSFDIWVSQIGGGGAVNLTAELSGSKRHPSWSPDGTRIAFDVIDEQAGDGCYVVSALGGAARKIISRELGINNFASRPQWSSDGERLACAVYGVDGRYVEIVSLETRESTRVEVPGTLGIWDLSWSRDSRYMAFVDAVNADSDTARLWVVRLSDGEAFAITDEASESWSPTWSPDSRFLYFVSNLGGSMDLWRIRLSDGRPDGSPQRVTVGLEMRSAELLADGTKLAYSKGRQVSNVWRVPLLSDRAAYWSDASQVTFDQAYIDMIDFAPGRRKLVLNSDRTGSPDLWLAPLDGGAMEPLTTSRAADVGPTWSPDESEILFYSDRTGNRDVWVIPVEGGAGRQLTDDPGADVLPKWSPDGRFVTYTTLRTGELDIWVVAADGSDRRRLLPDGAGLSVSSTWSPDGEWIYFSFARDILSSLTLARAPATGGTPEPVTAATAWHHAWAPSGDAIYFVSPLDHRLWAVSPEGGDERIVADLSGRRGNLVVYGLTSDGEFLYFVWEDGLGDIWTVDIAKD